MNTFIENRNGKKYVSVIWVDGKEKRLGTFNTLKEAIEARKEAERNK